MPLFSLIIVHGHGVAGHFNDFRLIFFQPPDEQPFEQTPEDKGAANPKQLEKPFDLIG